MLGHRPRAHFDVETVNVYNIAVDSALPEDHPGRTSFERGNAFVARDRIPADSLISLLYSHPVFQRFVARCFGLPHLHELADPLSGWFSTSSRRAWSTPGTSTPTNSP